MSIAPKQIVVGPRTVMKKILDWIGNSKWDLIHFNFGLWDWYGWKQGKKPLSNPMRRIWRVLLESLNQPVPNSYLR